MQDYKLSQLDAIEARWRSETDHTQDSSYYASSYSSWIGMSMNFAANIIENLQVFILYFTNSSIIILRVRMGLQYSAIYCIYLNESEALLI